MIKNKTHGITVSISEIRANDLLSQSIGLMFKSKQNLVMKFSSPRYVSLHNMFVNFPLEILLLDEDMKVIYVKKRFLPWTLFANYKKKAKYCVELGLSKSKGLCKVGEKLEIL